MKKFILLLATVLLVTMLFPASALAHGHGRSTGTRANYAPCNVEDCNITYAHRHDGTWYCGHSLNDGHDHHQVCSVQGCTYTTVHKHDGVACFPHAAGDGHSHHASSHKRGGRHH